MGTYVNPGNGGFKRILKGNYIDKTGMIEIINNRIETSDNLICISRPRRFGKSYAAKMLCAYYDHTCKSESLFDDKEISKSPSYGTHRNKYNVIYLDIAAFVSDVRRRDGDIKAVVNEIVESIHAELIEDYPELKNINKLTKCMTEYVKLSEKKFVFIIDEWDAIIREAKNDTDTHNAYLDLLREWFKNGNFTSEAVAVAYMTGILPIKKDKSQSAISDFDEVTVLEPGDFSEYIGFTEKRRCELWKTRMRSSFLKTSPSVQPGMKKRKNGFLDILKLIAGEQIVVNTSRFKNDFATFTSKDDVLTLLIHLGYLVYDSETKRVRIPNEEVRFEFDDLLQNAQHTKLAKLVQDSEKLLKDTLSGNEEAVASAIVRVRDTNYAPMFYNNEQALRYVIKFAYIICVDYYLKVEELPTGHGIADVVFIPKRDTSLPAMIVELKWNKTAEGALKQIKENHYPELLSDYVGEMMLVGINYNEETKEHSCKIEKIRI